MNKSKIIERLMKGETITVTDRCGLHYTIERANGRFLVEVWTIEASVSKKFVGRKWVEKLLDSLDK